MAAILTLLSVVCTALRAAVVMVLVLVSSVWKQFGSLLLLTTGLQSCGHPCLSEILTALDYSCMGTPEPSYDKLPYDLKPKHSTMLSPCEHSAMLSPCKAQCHAISL